MLPSAFRNLMRVLPVARHNGWLGLRTARPAGLRTAVHRINVGQADATVLEFPCDALVGQTLTNNLHAHQPHGATCPTLHRFDEGIERFDAYTIGLASTPANRP